MENETKGYQKINVYPPYDRKDYNGNWTDWCVADASSSVKEAIHNTEARLQQKAGDGFERVTGQLGDLKHLVKDTECNLTHVVKDGECRIIDRMSQAFDNANARVADGFKDITRDNMENRFQAQKGFHDLAVLGLNNTEKILSLLAVNKLDEKNEKINELLNEKYSDRNRADIRFLTQDLSYVSQKLNSLEQDQRVTSKTISFGGAAVSTNKSNQA